MEVSRRISVIAFGFWTHRFAVLRYIFIENKSALHPSFSSQPTTELILGRASRLFVGIAANNSILKQKHFFSPQRSFALIRLFFSAATVHHCSSRTRPRTIDVVERARKSSRRRRTLLSGRGSHDTEKTSQKCLNPTMAAIPKRQRMRHTKKQRMNK